ncbi:MAG: alpha-1,4-glucan--maltose-1-phosphate maltosyltransferase, partial [Myxococcales bacterium]|nr:alpha-1,4-glucan--maltose-1-phosphate maltosyltransferase [Myxococcales bacterium]
DFGTKDRKGLWLALREVLQFWIDQGVTVFRVDNPHTKAFPFWEWVIESLKADHPELIFLAEAFTRPKRMATLAKLGFTQSYTYYTWKNTRWEIEEYLSELSSDLAPFLRPNFFANTPDILHEYLQRGGRPAFQIRLILAGTLSPTYGIYSGYEFCENAPVREGSEEYLDSEKYEVKHRPEDAPGSLVGLITKLNDIRRAHPALSRVDNLQFQRPHNDEVLAFTKILGNDRLLVVAGLTPGKELESMVDLDLQSLGLDFTRPYEVTDLLNDATYTWSGSSNYVRLFPDHPVHILRVSQS